VADETRNQQRITNYAQTFFAIAVTEHLLGEVEDELFRFKQVLESEEELQSTLADPHIPAARRQQIVEDILQGRASDVTLSLVSMIVGLGRIRELPDIVDHLVEMSAKSRKRSVAEVRVAVELTDDQKARLAEALAKKTGMQIEVKVVIDPTVLGGVISQIDDTVIDGSVRSRLSKLRESI
jgi:F-type H+-transporting ATPase subunit delta